MKFQVQEKEPKREKDYASDELDIARTFAQRVYKEFGPFVKAVVLFGSAVKKKKTQDIDILIVLDDVRMKFSEDIVQTYRVIVEKVISDTEPKRLHIQSMKFSSFWEYARAGDPVAINILRYGIALVDTGFFDPLQKLLDDGRIRPSKEAIHTYFTMAPSSLNRAEQHLLTACVDLYWAVIDSAHAALMSIGEIPPSPDHVAGMLSEKLVKAKHLKPKHASTMGMFYKLFKDITYRNIKFVSGKEYDHYRKEAEWFLKDMQRLIEKKMKDLP